MAWRAWIGVDLELQLRGRVYVRYQVRVVVEKVVEAASDEDPRGDHVLAHPPVMRFERADGHGVGRARACVYQKARDSDRVARILADIHLARWFGGGRGKQRALELRGGEHRADGEGAVVNCGWRPVLQRAGDDHPLSRKPIVRPFGRYGGGGAGEGDAGDSDRVVREFAIEQAIADAAGPMVGHDPARGRLAGGQMEAGGDVDVAPGGFLEDAVFDHTVEIFLVTLPRVGRAQDETFQTPRLAP